MRRTLRRSCAACAKAKHKCDLHNPRCSRCISRKLQCVYANEPISSPGSSTLAVPSINQSSGSSNSKLSTFSVTIGSNSFDPFDSYPPTSLPRSRVQNLIVHFLSKIAFQYYPLDLNPNSNPFINSWWPLALADPALFNVSLQTASLDTELHAQKGFHQSAILMNDAVSLIRHKIDDPTLAFQDATMDAVVTLAAIEHGKGNIQECQMHIDAVKRMVAVRGGIAAVKQSSPLTARMVPWVSMLVTGSPQFDVQDDYGNGGGIAPIDQWIPALQPETNPDVRGLLDLGIDPSLRDILIRLQIILNPTAGSKTSNDLSTNDLHDLTCYVLHRLLRPSSTELVPRSESLRYALAIYMFVIHGPTYYSHMAILHQIVIQLRSHLQAAMISNNINSSLLTWCLSVGMSASFGTGAHHWFMASAATLSRSQGLENWGSVEFCLRCILILDARSKIMFQASWQPIFDSSAPSEEPPGNPNHTTALKTLLNHESYENGTK
ncbi:hypothetical protein ONS95_014288 [Cadophora gregata]|uniref:uncharacterized protein n=1 Tax=Cadophora gregata TaxID=51156 RepID=UPI0026DADFE8|nr:uncharacterized protein ONS95_014288 [Cadophora gregata]KAK0114048.1 hypothetical protein ONS96_014895 [Cadophora gregata f. sp. sojae]KAK0114807.1 hypothetical protein ONS95_014288 [Cadophora gregata]